jgi:hypothetical protein
MTTEAAAEETAEFGDYPELLQDSLRAASEQGVGSEAAELEIAEPDPDSEGRKKLIRLESLLERFKSEVEGDFDNHQDLTMEAARSADEGLVGLEALDAAQRVGSDLRGIESDLESARKALTRAEKLLSKTEKRRPVDRTRSPFESQKPLMPEIIASAAAKVDAARERTAQAERVAEIRRQTEVAISRLRARLVSCQEAQASAKGKVSHHLDSQQKAFQVALSKGTSSGAPLRDAEEEAAKLTQVETEVLTAIRGLEVAEKKLGALLEAELRARRERWVKAAALNRNTLIWAIAGLIVLPIFFGLAAEGSLAIWCGAALLSGIAATARVVWSKSTYPARMIGRSMDAGDEVILSSDERMGALKTGWVLLPLIPVLITLILGLVIGQSTETSDPTPSKPNTSKPKNSTGKNR